MFDRSVQTTRLHDRKIVVRVYKIVQKKQILFCDEREKSSNVVMSLQDESLLLCLITVYRERESLGLSSEFYFSNLSLKIYIYIFQILLLDSENDYLKLRAGWNFLSGRENLIDNIFTLSCNVGMLSCYNKQLFFQLKTVFVYAKSRCIDKPWQYITCLKNARTKLMLKKQKHRRKI